MSNGRFAIVMTSAFVLASIVRSPSVESAPSRQPGPNGAAALAPSWERRLGPAGVVRFGEPNTISPLGTYAVLVRVGRGQAAIDVRSGKTLWSLNEFDLGISDGHRAVVAGRDTIVSVGPRDGRVRWHASVPGVDAIAFDGARIVARVACTRIELDAETGRVRRRTIVARETCWSGAIRDQETHGGPIVAGDGKYVLARGEIRRFGKGDVPGGRTIATAPEPDRFEGVTMRALGSSVFIASQRPRDLHPSTTAGMPFDRKTFGAAYAAEWPDSADLILDRPNGTGRSASIALGAFGIVNEVPTVAPKMIPLRDLMAISNDTRTRLYDAAGTLHGELANPCPRTGTLTQIGAWVITACDEEAVVIRGFHLPQAKGART